MIENTDSKYITIITIRRLHKSPTPIIRHFRESGNPEGLAARQSSGGETLRLS